MKADIAGIIAAAKKIEQERLLALLDNELDQCTCDDKLTHLRERYARIGVKGEDQ